MAAAIKNMNSALPGPDIKLKNPRGHEYQTNKWIEVKLAQHMMCAMYMHYAFLNTYLF
jgi:hypothetical protein